MKISAVVLTKNEEKNIKECLKSVCQLADEIIIIDDNSKDQTREIAKKNGAKVFIRSLNNDFSSQRNFGLKKAKGDWILFVDADERITKSLAAEIKSWIDEVGPVPQGGINRSKRRPFLSGSDLNHKGFYVKRRDFVFGKWLKYGESGKIKLLRLGKKGAGFWKKPVHEAWDIRGIIKEFNSPLLHYPHSAVSEFLIKINKYSTLRAQELYKKGKRVGFFEVIGYPLAKFFKNFFWHLGFLDGLPGFLHAIIMSFHSFLVRGKLWLMLYI